MNEADWRVHIYKMTNEVAQIMAAEMLSGTRATVDARSCERGWYLIVECPDVASARSVTEIIIKADQAAELVHSAAGTQSDPAPA
jgi:hypothetical protein